MAKMTRFETCGRTSPWRWSGSSAAAAWWRCTSRRWWRARGGWLGLGLVWLGALTGLAPDAAAQADSPQLEVQVNLPYVLQYGFGTYAQPAHGAYDRPQLSDPCSGPAGVAGTDADGVARREPEEDALTLVATGRACAGASPSMGRGT
jgi:hypothetical protein